VVKKSSGEGLGEVTTPSSEKGEERTCREGGGRSLA